MQIMNKIIYLGLILILGLGYTLESKCQEVSEIPFIISAKGQILVQAHLNHNAEPKILILSTIKRSTIRKDKRPDLFKAKIDTSSIKCQLNSILFPGGFELTDIKLDWNYLTNREHNYYGNHIYGTIGPSILKNYICQFNFKTMRLKITKDIKQLNISDNALSTYFTSSFLNAYPTVEIYCDYLGKHEVSIDINSLSSINIPIDNFQGAIDIKKQKILFKEVYINDLKFDNITMSLSNSEPAVVGLRFLKDYIVTIDFTDKNLFLELNNQSID